MNLENDERNFIKNYINESDIERDTIAERYRFLFVKRIVTKIMKQNKMPQDKIRRSKKCERMLMNAIKRELNALWYTIEKQKETDLICPAKDEKSFIKEGNLAPLRGELSTNLSSRRTDWVKWPKNVKKICHPGLRPGIQCLNVLQFGALKDTRFRLSQE